MTVGASDDAAAADREYSNGQEDGRFPSGFEEGFVRLIVGLVV